MVNFNKISKKKGISFYKLHDFSSKLTIHTLYLLLCCRNISRMVKKITQRLTFFNKKLFIRDKKLSLLLYDRFCHIFKLHFSAILSSCLEHKTIFTFLKGLHKNYIKHKT